MVAFLKREFVSKVEGRQFVEVFAGRARTSRLASWCGVKTTAVDLLYSSAFNILKPAGFTFLGSSIFVFFMNPVVTKNLVTPSTFWAPSKIQKTHLVLQGLFWSPQA